MITIQSGIFDKARLFSNFLLIILVAGNIFFSIQYMENIRQQAVTVEDTTSTRIQTARFLKLYIDVVLNTKGAISYDNRVKLENDVRQLQDPAITKQWDTFVASKDAQVAQANAVKLMSMLTNKMLI